jgi:hypothetical protein
MNYPERVKKIERLRQRLLVLLRREDDPQTTMRYLADKIEEAGVAVGLSLETPEQFALDLSEALKTNDRDNWTLPAQPLRALESAEELVLSLLL